MNTIVSIALPSLFTPFDPESDAASEAVASLPGVPTSVLLMLFEGIANPQDLKSRVIAGDGSVPQCVMINPRLILDPFQLQAACSRAYVNQTQNSMKTKTILSEILFSLSPSMNIAESMKQFGISESTSSIFVLFPSSGSDSIDDTTASQITQAVGVAPIPVHYQLADVPSLKRVYKLTDVLDESKKNLVDLIVGGIATKGYL